MFTSSIPARYRTVAIPIFLLALISLFVHFHYDRERYNSRISQIFTYGPQQQNNGKGWYQSWRWSASERYPEDVIWNEVDREIAVKAGVDTEVVRVTRQRVNRMQEQCSRDKRIWEREYGYANYSLSSSFETVSNRYAYILRQTS